MKLGRRQAEVHRQRTCVLNYSVSWALRIKNINANESLTAVQLGKLGSSAKSRQKVTKSLSAAVSRFSHVLALFYHHGLPGRSAGKSQMSPVGVDRTPAQSADSSRAIYLAINQVGIT